MAASQPPHSLFPSFPIPFIPFIPSSCDRRHIPLHANLTKLEQARRANAAPSRAADSREFRVTTKDPAQGRQAAPRRRIPAPSLFPPDRKSVVAGTSVSERVDLGGRSISKKKTKTNN